MSLSLITIVNTSVSATTKSSSTDHQQVFLHRLELLVSDSHATHVFDYYLRQLQALKPTHAVVLELGDYFKYAGETYYAVQCLEKLVPDDQKTPAILIKLGDYYGLQDLPEKKLAMFEQARERAPAIEEKYWFKKGYADAQIEMGDYDSALTMLNRALLESLDNPTEKNVLLSSYESINAVGIFLDINNGLSEKQVAKLKLADNQDKKSILIVDSVVPRYDHDAGSVLMQGFIRSLVADGYSVFFYAHEKKVEPKYLKRLRECEARYVDPEIYPNFQRVLMSLENEIDVFMLTRADVGGVHFDTIRNQCPEKPIIFNSVDLHFVRLDRLYESKKNVQNLLESKRLKRREAYLIRNSDASVVISDAEVQILEDNGIKGNIWEIPIIVEFPDAVASFDKRKNIAFVGSYVHTPNVDAVDHFCKEIWPDLQKEFPDTKLLIVGPKAPERWKDEIDGINNVEVVGFVDDLEQFLAEIVCTIVPLRIGAGQKGKIATSMAHGVPCIASSVGIEGMNLTAGTHVLEANALDEWKSHLTSMLNEKAEWKRFSASGRTHASENFSEKIVGGKLISELNELLAAA